MPHSSKYVILDIDHLANNEVTAVIGPFTERAAGEWLQRKLEALERDGRFCLRHVPGISLSIEDQLGVVRELQRVPCACPADHGEKGERYSPL